MKAFPSSSPVLTALLTLSLVGCASSDKDKSDMKEVAAIAASAGADEVSQEIIKLEQRHDLAQARLEIARLEQQSYEDELETKLRHARTELELATSRLARFQDVQAPQRLAEGRLDLQGVRDRAQEAADELAQIEIMYEEQDLNDKTAEFVVSRGKRRAQRAKERIELQETALRSLEERELPDEEKRMTLEVDRAKAGLAAAERDGEIGRRRKMISVREAENEVKNVEHDLREKRKEQS